VLTQGPGAPCRTELGRVADARQQVYLVRIVSVLSSLSRQPVAHTAALLLGCAAAVLCSPSAELNAQDVQLRPHAALYLPSRISIQNRVLHARQTIGVAVGARLNVAFNQRFDAVAGVTYIPGYAVFRGAGKRIDVRASSHLLTATTGARYWVLPAARMLSWEVHTGVGVIFGGEPAYVDLFESSTVSGIVGTTLRCHIGRIMSLKLGVQERLYRVRFGGEDPGSSRPPLRITFGVDLPFVASAP
jgi:hypothetical protein